MNIGVILAGGDSTRFGGYINKQYLKLNGKEVVWYSIESMRQCSNIDKILLVVDEREYESGYIAEKYHVECVLGGATRNQSIKNALDYIHSHYDCDKVIFHDSVRPLCHSQVFASYIHMLDQYDGVISYSPINDALIDNQYRNVHREDYKLAQAPEGFVFDLIYRDFRADSPALAMVSQLASDNIHMCPSDIFDSKITYAEDLFVAEQLSRLSYYSVAHNEQFDFDIRDLGRVLLLGGSGGIGQALQDYFVANGISYLAPSHRELDLKSISVESIESYLAGRDISCIINAAAIYYDDNDGLVSTFEDIFNVNVKANLVFIEYAKRVGHKINLVFLSSSSSTKGRENLTNYSAAKSALNSIVESQANTLAGQDIYINAIIPEKVNTPLIEKLHKHKINTRELLDPKDVINTILYYATAREYGKLVHIRKGL